MIRFKARAHKKIELPPITGKGGINVLELNPGDVVTSDTSGFGFPVTIISVKKETQKMIFFLMRGAGRTFEKSYLKTTYVDIAS